MVDVYSTLIWFILGTAGSTYLVAFAYKNTKFILKHKVCKIGSFCDRILDALDIDIKIN